MSAFRSRNLNVALATCTLAAAAMLAPATATAAFPGPDGPIAFESDRDGPSEIYSIVPGSQAFRLTESTASADPAYSPDGSKIAFVTSDNEIAVMNADGTNPAPITDSATAKQEPAWSPDGSRVAYAANSFDVDGQTDLEIWAVSASGGAPEQLTKNTFPDSQPAWSPSGTRIAFVATRPGDANRNVYVMDANGMNEVNITPDEAAPCDPCYQGHDDNPAWSPDGSKIAYVHNQTENAGGPPNIWVMDPNGASKANLSNSSTSFTEPAWSPQGTRLAAVGAQADSTDRNIWVMNADGGGQAPIDTSASHDISPDWGVASPAQVPNDISFDQVKRNKKKGTAKLTVQVPGPGALELAGKGVKPGDEEASAAGDVVLKIKAAGKARKALKKDGKAKVKPAVTFTPLGGEPNTEKTKVKLVKK